MPSTFRNRIKEIFSFMKQRGAVTLVTALVLVLTSTLIVMFATKNSRMLTIISANVNRNAQATYAAQAGIQFGINYLKQNTATVIATPISGYINYSDTNTTNVALSNGSKFSVAYTNPTANNYNILRITATGVNDDASSSRVYQVIVKQGSLLSTPPTITIVTKGSVTMGGNGNVVNTGTNQTIKSAAAVNLYNNSKTTISTGVSSSATLGINADVQQNNVPLANTSFNDFFASYFGTTSTSSVSSQTDHYYSNSSTTNYGSTLNGMMGTSIWIDQTGGDALVTGNITIGSATNPVLIVVNGPIAIAGNVTIYGYIVVLGSTGLNTIFVGNINLIGGLASIGNIITAGNTTFTYNQSVINNLMSTPSMAYWAPVPGTWKDF